MLNEDGLRYEDEFVKHKILDAIGDLYLLGHSLIGEFSGHKSGHALNNQLLRKLLADARRVGRGGVREARRRADRLRRSRRRSSTALRRPAQPRGRDLHLRHAHLSDARCRLRRGIERPPIFGQRPHSASAPTRLRILQKSSACPSRSTTPEDVPRASAGRALFAATRATGLPRCICSRDARQRGPRARSSRALTESRLTGSAHVSASRLRAPPRLFRLTLLGILPRR